MHQRHTSRRYQEIVCQSAISQLARVRSLYIHFLVGFLMLDAPRVGLVPLGLDNTRSL